MYHPNGNGRACVNITHAGKTEPANGVPAEDIEIGKEIEIGGGGAG